MANAVPVEGRPVGPSSSLSQPAIRQQQLAANANTLPNFGNLNWTAITTPQGTIDYVAPEKGGGYYSYGVDKKLYHEPTAEQAGLDVNGFPQPNGGGGYLLAQNVATFFGATADVPKIKPPMNKPPTDTGTGKGGSSTGTGTGTGGNTTNPTPEGGVSTSGGLDPTTAALLSLIEGANSGGGAGANYIPYSSGGIVPSTSGSTATSGMSMWLIIGILAIVGAGGWYVYHKYLKKDFDK